MLGTYRDLPLLVDAMLGRGFQVSDIRKVLGGNYVRVYTASTAGGRSVPSIDHPTKPPDQAAVSKPP